MYRNKIIASVVDKELQKLIKEGKYYVIDTQGVGNTFSIMFDDNNVANVYDVPTIDIPDEHKIHCSDFITASMLRPISNTHVESASLIGPMGTEALIGSRIYLESFIKGHVEYMCPIINVKAYTLIPSIVYINGTCKHQVSLDIDYNTTLNFNNHITDTLEYSLGHNDNLVIDDIDFIIRVTCDMQHDRKYHSSIAISNKIDSEIYHHIEPQHYLYSSNLTTEVNVVDNLKYVKLENIYIIKYADKIILAGDFIGPCVRLPLNVISSPIKL